MGGCEIKKISLLSFFSEPQHGDLSDKINDILTAQEQLYLMRSSFEKNNDLHQQHILTDSPHFDSDICVITSRIIKHDTLTLDALRLQLDFLSAYDFSFPLIVCDPDLLFFKNVSHVFDGSFDVAFTKRKNVKMPYNSGIFFVNNANKEAVCRFWRLQVSVIEDEFMCDSGWYADQLVLKKITEELGKKISSDLYLVDGVRVKILDGHNFNYSPKRDHPYLFYKPSVCVYHFKGRCRNYMSAFYRYYVADRIWLRNFPIFVYDCLRLEYERKMLKDSFKNVIKRS